MRWSSVLVLCLSLLSTPVWAEELVVYPPQGVQTFLGLDDTSAPTQVQDGRAQDLQNVLLDQAESDFTAITGLYYTKFSSGTERIIAMVDDWVYYLNGSVWTPITEVAITAGQNNQFVFTTALDNIIGTNNVDAPFQYDGATLTSVSFAGSVSDPITSTPTRANTVAFFKNYLIFGNTKESGTNRPTRLRWSNVGTINTWTEADRVDIGALGGQEITGMAELYDNLYVFLTNSIYKVSLVGGVDTFQISKVVDGIGCIAKNSIQSITLTNAQNGLIFLDKRKRIYFFNGVIAQDISTLLRVTMDALSGSRLQYAVSANSQTDYLLSVTSGTGSTNNLILDLQYQIGEWTKHTNLPANAMAAVLDNNSAAQVYLGNYTNMVYQYQDTSLRDDVGTLTGTLSSVGVNRVATSGVEASGLQVLFIDSAEMTTGALVGAPLELIGGTGATQTNTIAYNTQTGLFVTSTFATTPDSTTTFELGAIDAFYTTKWYDYGDPARLKHFGEVYFWADADVSSTHSLSYATDFNSDISTLSLSLSASTTDAIWGSAIWGTSLWGNVDQVFRQAKMTASGRYHRLKWADDDPHETFHMLGYSTVFRNGDLN